MKGFIYKIYCNTEKKSYIGQTVTYPNSTMKDAVKLRFLNHLSKSRNDPGCGEITKKIVEYGTDDFSIEMIATVPRKDLDDTEQYFIKMYNTFHPNGYNLTTGGSTGTKYCEQSKKLISKSQIGNRREKKDRLYEEDNDLPKNITSLRNSDGTLYGYIINNFAVGTTKREYISRKFGSTKFTPSQNLLMAKYCLFDLKKEHKKSISFLKKKRKNKSDAEDDNIDFTLPKEITKVYNSRKELCGFMDVKTSTKFTTSKQLHENIKSAFSYFNSYELKEQNKKFKPVIDKKDIGMKRVGGENLPKNVSFVKAPGGGEVIGYCINNFRLYNDDGTLKKLVKKKFCSKKEPMKDKYNRCIDYLNQLKQGIQPQ
jgi:group I intron endonuclease